MIAPEPNVFSIWLSVLFSAFSSAVAAAGFASVVPCRFATAIPPLLDLRTLYTRTLTYHANTAEVKRWDRFFSPAADRGRARRSADLRLSGLTRRRRPRRR